MLETERLILRRWTLDDVPATVEIYGDAETMRLFGSGKTFSPTELAASLADVISGYDQSSLGNHAVVEKESGRILGHCGVHRSSDPGIELEADWLIRRDSWRRGYATEAAIAAIGRVFATGEATVISGVARSDNAASLALMRKLGMQYVRGQLREGFESVVYALTAERFSAHHKLTIPYSHGAGA